MTAFHHLAARARLRALALRPVVFALAALLTGADASLSAQETARVLAPPVGAHEEAIEQARSRAQSVVAEANLPGLSAAVGLDGEVVWAEGFGWADLEQRVPISPLSRFRIGSVSKPLTAATVGLLYERGLLDLDAPVQTYVPSFPEKRWPISTRQLMGHIAGIRHYSSDEEVLSVEDYGSNVLAGLDIFADDSLLFRPGTESSYSTYGWNLVAAVVEAAADEPFLDFMRKEVFAPLGMRHTVPDYTARIVAHRVSFYAHDGGERLRNARHVDQSNKWGGGGFLSTPTDLVRFGFAMLEGDLLEPETIELLWTPVRLESGESTGYGLGWVIRELNGDPMIGHGGSSIGGRTSFMIHPGKRMVVAITSNVNTDVLASLAIEFANLFDPAREVAQRQPLGEAERSRYIGEYRLEERLEGVLVDVRIFEEAGRLMAQATGQGAFGLAYQGEHTFVVVDDDEEIRLVFDLADNRATGFTLNQAGQTLSARRIEP